MIRNCDSVSNLSSSSPNLIHGLPGGLDSKKSACCAGDPGLIPGSGGSCGEGNGNPLQYPYLENSMDREVWWATVHGVAKSWTQLSDIHSHSQYNIYTYSILGICIHNLY